MKFFKYILLAFACVAVAFSADAQVAQSKSYNKKIKITKEKVIDNNPWKKCQWYGKVGALIPTSSNSEYYKGTAGFDLDFGFKLRMGRHGWYWSMDLALLSGGAKTTDKLSTSWDSSKSYFGARLGFTTFGWRVRFSDFILDLHAGLAVRFITGGHIGNPYEESSLAKVYREELAAPLGVSLCYKKFFFDMTGLIDASGTLSIYKPQSDYGRINNLAVSVGYLF